MNYKVVSVDDHATEGPGTFVDRVPSSMKSKVPTMGEKDGITWWFLEGKPLRFASTFIRDEKERETRRAAGGGVLLWEHGRPGDWDPRLRLKDYDLDGVDAAVMFANFTGNSGTALSAIKDMDVRLACVRAYNDWLIEEFCAADSKRLYGQSILPAWDIELTKDEALRTIKMGHRAIVWNGMMDVAGLKPTWDSHWDPLYTSLEEMAVPISIHLGGTGWGQMGIRTQANATSVLGKDVNPAVPAFVSTSLNIAGVLGNMYPLIEILMSGMLERLPRLRIYLAEGGASWAPFVLRMCDYYWQRYSAFDRNNLRMLPSEYARRQVYYGVFLDQITSEVAKTVGEDKLMWEADYNHTVATFPNSRKYQEESLAPITDPEVRAKILAGNAVKLFRMGE